MNKETFTPTNTAAWNKLIELASEIQSSSTPITIQQLFVDDADRVNKYSFAAGELTLDFSKNLIDDQTFEQLLNLAIQSPLLEHRDAMFSGEAINRSEDRSVLHAALRANPSDDPSAEGKQRAQQVEKQLEAVERVSHEIRQGKWLGSTGKAITDIVNIGIGGSDLGAKMACTALEEFAHESINVHFISNVDGAQILTTLKKLNPETTLVSIASKTFTTQETMLNAKTAIQWFSTKLGLENPKSSRHFIGLTANPSAAIAYGIPENQILEFSDWVGGRYSLWSSIGLSIAISIGFENFKQMLDGARDMDQHFQNAPIEKNMPVILGLLGIWYSNFLNAQSIAIIPYCERLGLLPSYLQQLDMESNGKSTSLDGKSVNYNTGPILWGQTGTNGQHAFFQLLHQGTRMVPIDFIAAVKDNLSNSEHHEVLLGNMLAQASALMEGQAAPDGEQHRFYPGNKPSNILLVDTLSPRNFGALIALYEHKVFVQGSIWNINSFDQWGVELGKKMANNLLDKASGASEMDPSTVALFSYIEEKS
jgi:glucose-6-phosphate isomerase